MTHRLRQLTRAYRRAKRLLGRANKGAALLAPAIRWCSQLRRMLAQGAERVHAALYNRRPQQ